MEWQATDEGGGDRWSERWPAEGALRSQVETTTDWSGSLVPFGNLTRERVRWRATSNAISTFLLLLMGLAFVHNDNHII